MALGISRFFIGKTRVILFAVVVLAALYLLAVTPVRTYINQRHQMAQAEQRYAVLASANKALTDRATQLQSDAEVERIAREQYELVPPGQVAFAVMPPAASSTTTTATAPDAARKGSFWSRAVDDITFWN